RLQGRQSNGNADAFRKLGGASSSCKMPQMPRCRCDTLPEALPNARVPTGGTLSAAAPVNPRQFRREDTDALSAFNLLCRGRFSCFVSERQRAIAKNVAKPERVGDAHGGLREYPLFAT